MSRISDNFPAKSDRADNIWCCGIELELRRWEVISSTGEALRALIELWPQRRRAAVDEAIDICMANLEGTRSDHECRRALLRAALMSKVEINRIWVRADDKS